MIIYHGYVLSTKQDCQFHLKPELKSDANGKPDGFSIVVSNAGDWTNNIIHNPPKKLWVHGYLLHGLLYTSRLFHKIIVVATSSGIRPPLSLFLCNYNEQIHVFWSTPTPETTYGSKIRDTVKKADPNAWIWDTHKQGHPDMVACTYKMVVESGVEAVYIILNLKLTRRVVYGMES
ncbi:hypothetical protein GYMLUDRAFT_60669 [Collybiopsis luxurians FD-317 M1]|uniref:Uncharacterized protein n=1 Tax=Collybiopsis luxurians FD-317 M1 TaxID=944289 RepID=A0A0D0CJR5_9AGAR|nr:hypothetical protein GYMLUDRAFT_60669 [Collybiopsis luxurians FD-317 M1]